MLNITFTSMYRSGSRKLGRILHLTALLNYVAFSNVVEKLVTVVNAEYFNKNKFFLEHVRIRQSKKVASEKIVENLEYYVSKFDF